MSDTKWLLKQGFEICKSNPSGFSLLSMDFNKTGIRPFFNNSVRSGECPHKKGLVAYYSNRCPFSEYHVRESLVETAGKRNLLLKTIKLETMKEAPKLEVIARIATENELITCQKVIASFVTKSAEERYIDLLDTQGELFQRVPQHYIASFLGVSPETLSRIKARVFKAKQT